MQIQEMFRLSSFQGSMFRNHFGFRFEKPKLTEATRFDLVQKPCGFYLRQSWIRVEFQTDFPLEIELG